MIVIYKYNGYNKILIFIYDWCNMDHTISQQ